MEKTLLRVKKVVRRSVSIGEETRDVGFQVAGNLAVDVSVSNAFNDTRACKIASKGRRAPMAQGKTTGILVDVRGKKEKNLQG